MTLKIKGKTVFLLVAGAGVIVTTVLAAKSAPDAQAKKEAALQEKRERTGDENAQLTTLESIRAQIGSYIPTIVSAMVTLGSLTGSEILNERNLQKAEKAFDNYKDMTERIDGKGARKVLEKAVEQKAKDDKAGKPWEKEETYRIIFQGRSIQFEKTRSEVMEVIYAANRTFHEMGRLTFNELLEYFGQEDVGVEGDRRGWDAYVGEAIYGYTWIDFGLKECPDEPWVTEIYMACYPHFLDEEDANAELEEGVAKLTVADMEQHIGI